MKPPIPRRDFLKFSSLLPLLARDWGSPPQSRPSQGAKPPNFLVLLFDAFSAPHASLYGYPRLSTPNLERIAERAIVYHNHYSTSNFTSPGAASILTGTHPWTHRANHLFGLVDHSREANNIFRHLASKGYTRLGYSHNALATTLLYQFSRDIDLFHWPRSFGRMDLRFSDLIFRGDFAIANLAENLMLPHDDAVPGALFSSLLRNWSTSQEKRDLGKAMEERYPEGVPYNYGLYFTLEETIDGLMEMVPALAQPYFAYVHLLPPHGPYLARREFHGMFSDEWKPERKRQGPFSDNFNQRRLNRERRRYDDYLANVDAELGRLVDFLQASGSLENTYLFITSDHGEMFERGTWGHLTQMLYQPVIRTPLVILKPGQAHRQDVHLNTSAVDLLPTLMSLAGLDVPMECEGEILPPFDGSRDDPQRNVFCMEAKTNPKHAPLTTASFALLKGRDKLTHYYGYNLDENDQYEMYRLDDDPEELKDRYSKDDPLARELREILLSKINEVNQGYT